MKSMLFAAVNTQGKQAQAGSPVQETPSVMYCHDNTLEEMVMIFKGTDGD